MAPAFEYASTNQQTGQQSSRSPAYYRYVPDTGLPTTGPQMSFKSELPLADSILCQ
jgi:hypothetical protein